MIKEGFIEIGIESEKISDLTEKMEKFANEIILFNSAYNLTNTSDLNEIFIRHIFDSLSPYKFMKNFFNEKKQNVSVADIGSGGGFPGIPLACAFPEINFSLVERMSKRCAFLQNETAILNLKNVTVINLELEKLKTKFDLVTFRAFRPLDKKITTSLLNITNENGIIVAYKAKKSSIETEMNEIKSLVPEYEIIPLTVPGLEDSERNLVVI